MRKIPDIRLIATDLDGTLLGDDHISVSERNARALRAASEQGIRLAIASGRTRSELAHVLECLPFLDYLIQANGAAVTDLKSGRILLSDDIPYEQWVRLRSLLRAYGAVYNTYCRGVSYIESDVLPRYNRTDLSPEFVDSLRKCMPVVEDVTKTLAGKGAEKLCVLCCTPEENYLPLREARFRATLRSTRLTSTRARPWPCSARNWGTSPIRSWHSGTPTTTWRCCALPVIPTPWRTPSPRSRPQQRP